MGPLSEVAELSREELEAGVGDVRRAPADEGTLELIALRPEVGERELPAEARLEAGHGVVGDNWERKPSSKTGEPNPEAEVTVMSARAAALVADSGDHEGWAQAGDQLYVDLDIGEANLPVGARLVIGDAVLEVTAEPHTGCGKFIRRYGVEAMKFVNSEVGRELRLRGVNTRVVEGGTVRAGDSVRVQR